MPVPAELTREKAESRLTEIKRVISVCQREMAKAEKAGDKEVVSRLKAHIERGSAYLSAYTPDRIVGSDQAYADKYADARAAVDVAVADVAIADEAKP